jgi:protein TonB
MIVSFITHIIVVGAWLVLSALAPDLLPTPRQAVIQAFPRMMHAQDIQLPEVSRPPTASRTPASAANVVAPNAAPLVAPSAITPETGLEASGDRQPGPPVAAIEQRGLTAVDIGPIETPPPPAPQAKLPIRMHSGIEPPRKIVDVAPIYPPIAQASRVSGIVIVEATIDDEGSVTAARILRSHPLLEQAAVDAVRRWKFTPARLNGQAVAVVMTVTINFTLQQ